MPAHISVWGRISWARVFQTCSTYRFIVSTLFNSEHRGPFILVRIESCILIGWRKMPHISIVHSQLLFQIRILVLRHLDSVHPAKHRHIILLLSSSRFLLQTNIIGRFASYVTGPRDTRLGLSPHSRFLSWISVKRPEINHHFTLIEKRRVSVPSSVQKTLFCVALLTACSTIIGMW